jgi:hypothetical protein
MFAGGRSFILHRAYGNQGRILGKTDIQLFIELPAGGIENKILAEITGIDMPATA